MRLVSFSVENYRSITRAKKIPLSSYSLLVGANNEGKSNILHALALAMDTLVDFKTQVRRNAAGSVIRTSRSNLTSQVDYIWTRDFPIEKQTSSRGDKRTKITLEFELSLQEVADFKTEIKSNLNGTLPITIALDERWQEFVVAKQGPGGSTLTKKATRIAEFVSQRISFEYIPAIRTADSATQVISRLVARELAQIEGTQEFLDAMEKIETLQEPILEKLAKSVQTTVSSFLPSVKRVKLQQSRDSRRRLLRREIAIRVDDGSETRLERKGDGVQSLVALALMRHVAEQRNSNASSVIAIEEPEAHLHPGAVHELKKVITDLAQENQIVLSSHSPIFVDPGVIESTIIVQKNRAEPAKKISDVRQALGVRFSDNLQSARVVGIVEGTDDIIALNALLPKISPKLQAFFDNGEVVLDELSGASNLTYKVRLLQGSACEFQCFLDNDTAGKSAIKAAIDNGVISLKDYSLTSVSGLRESELEDLYDVERYKADFRAQFGVDATLATPQGRRKKWSDAMGARFKASGKIWSEKEKLSVKSWLAREVERQGFQILDEKRKRPLELFAEALLVKLNNKS